MFPFTHECKRSDLQNLAELDEETIAYIESTRNCVEQNSKCTCILSLSGSIEISLSRTRACSTATVRVLTKYVKTERTWELLREDGFDDSTEPGANVRRADAYVDDYFFVSMLYQSNWSPKDSVIDKTAFRIIGPTRDNSSSPA